MSITPNEIIPVVAYEDIRAAHDGLVDVLGFESGGLYELPDGTVIHGEVCAGSNRIWLHAVAGGLETPRRTSVATSGIVVFVPNVDEHFAYAKAKGAEIVREPEDQEYGLRDYGARDPEGHPWYISTPLAP